jgi:PAS domain S-box-containing protein
MEGETHEMDPPGHAASGPCIDSPGGPPDHPNPSKNEHLIARMTDRDPAASPWLPLTLLCAPCLALAGLELYQAVAWKLELERGPWIAAIAGAVIAVSLMVGGVMRTLTAHREALRLSAAKRSDEDQLRALVEGVADHALYMLDTRGYVTTWNAGAQRIKGYTADQIVGQHFSRFFTEEDQKAGVPERALDVAARHGKYESEGWRVRGDGTRFYSRAVVTALYDSQQKLTGFLKITRDVTEKVQQEEALEQARAALAQSQKMEALGQLTGGMAHDFNNILHVIKNSVELLQTRLGREDPLVVRFLDAAKRNVDRAASVTQRLLAFARQQPLNPVVVSPNKLVQSMADLVRHAVGEGVAVETVFSSGLWSVSVDTNQLETALLNLTINSRDAMQRVGKLTIETANAFLDETYAAEHAEVIAGQYVMIAVSDTGSGMSKEVAARAFDPFFTTKSDGQGTGLGLSQVFGFVKQSGGHVKIYSEPGEGTTVKLYLPRFSANLAVAATEPLAVNESAKGESILVVEDHEDVRTFAVEMLTSLGYRVSGTADGPTALRALGQIGHIDLLFTDVGLPNGMNGRQLAEEARRLQPDLRVLFTTAYARNAIVHHGRLDAGVDLLLKPYTQLDLARKVRQVLGGAEE